MLIVGEKEQAEGAVSVRDRKEGDTGSVNLDEFYRYYLKESGVKI